MAKFLNIPPLDIGEKKEQWILTEDCIYVTDVKTAAGPRSVVIVPNGFVTDLASIPRIFRLLIVKNGKHRPAAIVHDYLCSLRLDFSRVSADKIFYEAMKVCKVPRIRRRLMYMAVALNTKRMKFIGKAR